MLTAACLLLLPVLAFYVHVLDRGFIDHQVGLAVAVYLDAALVIPLDIATNLFPITELNHHRSLRLHLLLIIEVLRISGLRRRKFLAAGSPLHPLAALHRRLTLIMRRLRMMMAGGAGVMLVAVQQRTNQFAVGKSFLLDSPFRRHGINCVFHDCTACLYISSGLPQHRVPVIVGTLRCENLQIPYHTVRARDNPQVMLPQYLAQNRST